MKRLLYSLAFLAAIASCSKEVANDSVPDETGNPELTAEFESVLATASDFEFANPETKTVISQSGSNPPSFAWKSGDIIGIVPNDDKSLQANYEIAEIGDDPKSAQFDGGSWALKRDRQYAAYYPYKEKLIRSTDTLQFSFLGQRIAANNSLAHLGTYDYMYASATFPEGGNAALNFSHLISLVRFQITVNHSETYTKLALNSPDNCDWFASKAYLTLGTGAMTAIQSQKSIEIPFDNIALSKGDVLTVWIAMLPTSILSGKKLGFILHGSEYDYSGEFTNLPSFEPGKAYSFSYVYPQKEEVLTIKNADDWEKFASAVQAANRDVSPDMTALKYWLDNGVVTLASDITLPGNFTRVPNEFNYTFDGGNHTITINEGTHALFYSLGPAGIIKNLVIDGSMVDGSSDDGVTVLVSSLYGTIDNCTNNACITVSKAMNMAVAPFAKVVNNGLIKDCVNNGNISIECNATAADRNVYVGGIAARVFSGGSGNYSKPAVHFLNCTNKGKITVDINNAGGKKIGYAGFGGIVGWVARDRSKFPTIKFENCLNTGGISVHNTYDGSGSDFATSVGGIAGLCWGDFYNSDSQTETYHLGVTEKTQNQNKVFFLNCTNSGKLENNTTSYCGTQKLWGKSYTGGIAGSVYCFDSVFGLEPVFDGCVSTGDVVPYSLSDSERPGLESVAGGILGIGCNVTFKNCTVTATVGTEQRLAFAIAGVMGIAAGKFTVDNCAIYPHLIMGRCFITAQNNWGLIATYPVRGNTTIDFPSGSEASNALTAVKILFSNGALPSLEGSEVKNCRLGGEWVKINSNDVTWNSKEVPTLTQSTDKFNKLANCEENGVRGNDLKLNSSNGKLMVDDANFYRGRTSGDVTFSGNTLLTSPPVVD